jgi:hypothetical protein
MIKTTRFDRRALALALCTLAGTGGCLAGGGSVESGDDASDPNAIGVSHVHMMPVTPGLHQGSIVATSAPAGAHLTYYGGPVISNVKVWTVFWNSSVANQSTINSFYQTITSSAYFDWLTEYNTSSQTIGHGSLGGSVVDTGAPTGSSVTDTQIQKEITRLIQAGTLPTNDGNNLYMVYFPPGVTIAQGTSHSCQEFCAYHGTFTLGGKDAFYGVIPDLGGACATGCGTGSQLQNTTSVSSHEMIESVTDPAVGLAQSLASPLAWYDQTNGEIGDICNAQQAVVSGFTVQKEFSNAANDCIATKGTGGGGGSGGSGGSGAGGTGAGGTGAGGSGAGGSGGGGGSCSHSICSSGTKLTSTCDSCATAVCAQDSYCCTTKWDSQCVGEVGSICGESCSGGTGGSGGSGAGGSGAGGTGAGGSGGGSTCTHAICNAGAKLKSTCDPCASAVCAQDSYCCSTKWDAQCVSEVGSICGESCP